MAALKTIYETLPTLNLNKSNVFYVVKKGKKYMTFKNNELALTLDQLKAVVFKSEKQLVEFIDNVTVDDRNARIIGNSYGIVDVDLRLRKD